MKQKMKWKNTNSPLAQCSYYCAICLALLSCKFIQEDFPQPRNYQVAAPKIGGEFGNWLNQNGLKFSAWHWKLQYIGSSYDNNALQLRSEIFRGKPDEQLDLTLKKKESVVIRAFPIFSKLPPKLAITLWKPAGVAIMWQSNSNDENSNVQSYNISATWEQGFFSEVLARLLNKNFDIRHFNSEKLQYYIQSRFKPKAGNLFSNYWNYDLQHIVSEISALKIDWYDIRLRKNVVASGIPSGRWQALNVAEPVLNCPCQPILNIGQHYFLELNHMKLWQLQVLTEGEVLALEL